MAFNPFAGAGKAKTYENGKYLAAPGNYLLEVKKLIYKQTVQSGPAFIAEVKVLESNREENPEGSTASWFQGMKSAEIALPSLKDFMLTLMKINRNDSEEMLDFDNKLDELLLTVTTEPDTMEGWKIRCETQQVKTKKDSDFTRHKWSMWEGPQPGDGL